MRQLGAGIAVGVTALLLYSGCPGPQPGPRKVEPRRPRDTRPVKRYAKAPAPFVAVVPGTKLYARPDTRAPYVQVGLSEGEPRSSRGCDQNTVFPTAMRALKWGHGWVQVETLSKARQAGRCIDPDKLGERFRLRAWVLEEALGTVMKSHRTATYDEGLKVKIRGGTAVLPLVGKLGHYCVDLNLPRWQAHPRGNHTHFAIKLPPTAVTPWITPQKWSAAPEVTHELCFQYDASDPQQKCMMQTWGHSPRALASGEKAVWMTGTCVRNEVRLQASQVRLRPASSGTRGRVTGGGGAGGGGAGGMGFGGWGGFGGSGGSKTKPKPPPNPTLHKSQPLLWTDGTSAGSMTRRWYFDLGKAHWRQGRLCTSEGLGTGPKAGLCVRPTALKMGPIAAGKGADAHASTLGYGAALFTGQGRKPLAKLVTVRGTATTAAALRKSLIPYLGHLELCHAAASSKVFGDLQLQVHVGSTGRVTRVVASSKLSGRLRACARTLLRLLPLRNAPAGQVNVALKLEGMLDATGSRGFGVGNYRNRGLRVFMSRASVSGGLDAATIRRVIRRHLSELKYCYLRHANSVKPKPKGMLRVDFQIDPSGRVKKAKIGTSALKHKPTTACVLRAARKWRFPKPEGSTPKVSYPFHFKPGR